MKKIICMFISGLLLAPVFAQTEAPKPERFGFKDIPFGIPKDALIRQLCVRYGFKQTSTRKRPNYSEMKLQELIMAPECCFAKYILAKDTVEARWSFNAEGKFSEVQFRKSVVKKDATPEMLKEQIRFFNSLFEAKYGPPETKIETELKDFDSVAVFPCWVWNKTGAAIQTGFLADPNNYYSVASIALPR